MPWRVPALAQACEESRSAGGTTPMLPAIGSTMMAAIVTGVRVAQRFDGREIVVAREQRVGRHRRRRRRGWSGLPSVVAPEPAFTRNASAWP